MQEQEQEILVPDVETRSSYKDIEEEPPEIKVDERCMRWLDKVLARPRTKFAIELSKTMDEEEFIAQRARFSRRQRVRKR